MGGGTPFLNERNLMKQRVLMSNYRECSLNNRPHLKVGACGRQRGHCFKVAFVENDELLFHCTINSSVQFFWYLYVTCMPVCFSFDSVCSIPSGFSTQGLVNTVCCNRVFRAYLEQFFSQWQCCVSSTYETVEVFFNNDQLGVPMSCVIEFLGKMDYVWSGVSMKIFHELFL